MRTGARPSQQRGCGSQHRGGPPAVARVRQHGRPAWGARRFPGRVVCGRALMSWHGPARRAGRRLDQRSDRCPCRRPSRPRQGHRARRDLHAGLLRTHPCRAHAVRAGPGHGALLQRRRRPKGSRLRARGPRDGGEVLSPGRQPNRRRCAQSALLPRPHTRGLRRVHAGPQTRPGNGPARHGEDRSLSRRSPRGAPGHPGHARHRSTRELRDGRLQLDPHLPLDRRRRPRALGALSLRARGRRVDH